MKRRIVDTVQLASGYVKLEYGLLVRHEYKVISKLSNDRFLVEEPVPTDAWPGSS